MSEKIKVTKFKVDHREENAGLHLLYVKTAVKHLKYIDEVLGKLDDFANMNILDLSCAIQKERTKLVKENAAYADADEIVQIFRDNKDD